MTFRVHVIGLGGQRPAAAFHDLLSTYPIFARCGESARGWLREDDELAADFDALFDNDSPGEIRTALLAKFADAAQRRDGCLYLVPGAGQLGDLTVAALARQFDVQIHAGLLPIEVPLADAQIIDALALAEAEETFPFDGGHAVPDPVRPVVVTHLRGRSVVRLALQRLQRIFGGAIEAGQFRAGSDAVVVQPAPEPGAVRSYLGLERIVATLRSPEGCPWDREQSVETLLPMMLDEIEEFREAVRSGDVGEQADELGDVLLHIAMIAQISRERHGYGSEDMLEAITGKMVRRHPHVFGDVEVASIDELYEVWQRVKDSERAGDTPDSHQFGSGG